jgi:ferredoxin
MPEKYHIKTQVVPPRLPRIGKFGVVDWREDCARCHNCVKKECVYDRYRQEMQYIRGLREVDAFFFECMGCFSCVQKCTKGLLALSLNPAFERLGNSYWNPDIILTTWAQAETAAIPVSGAGYRGKFSGPGFDSMWTDMSEIVRPTRDGIHGREYISTSVDIGRKPSVLNFDDPNQLPALPSLVDLPMPLMIDMMSPQYRLPALLPVFKLAAARTGLIAITDWRDWQLLGDDKEKYLSNLAFYFDDDVVDFPQALLQKTRLVEICDGRDVEQKISQLKAINPRIVVMIRVNLDLRGEERAVELAHRGTVEVIHVVADENGNQIGVDSPLFIKDILRNIHTALVKNGIRDEVTLAAGGGIALAEHLAKQILCGADVVTINLPLLIGLECRLCHKCNSDVYCPAGIGEITPAYAVGRMTNLIAAWHDQLIEMMGAMGIREARRLRGETGRAMFFEDVEEETFGKLFGSRKGK